MQFGSEGPPPRSAASPSSSSSNQSQQQLAYKQMLSQHEHQQQQLRKSEGEQTAFSFQSGAAHGIFGGSPVPPSSGANHLSQAARKFNEMTNQPGTSQQHEGNQNKVQGANQQAQFPIQQAYFQYAMHSAQQKSQANLIMQQQGKSNSVSLMGRDQDMHANNLKMQELMSLQASANLSQVPTFRRANENFVQAEKHQVEQGNASNDKKNDLKPPAVAAQLVSTNMARPMQAMGPQVSMQNITNNQLAISQMQAMQAFAKENNIDLSVPGNVNIISQMLPYWQFNKMAVQKQNETSSNVQQRLPTSKPLVAPAQVGNENSAHGSSSSDCSGQPGPLKGQLTLTSGTMSGVVDATSAIPSNLQMQQQVFPLGRVNQNERVVRPPRINDNGTNMAQMQYLRPLQQMNRPLSQPAVPVSDVGGPPGPTQGGSVQAPQEFGFTKQQLFILKAQILAFRRLKRGERTLPPEVLQAIDNNIQSHQSVARTGVANQDEPAARNTEEVTRHIDNNTQSNQPATLSRSHAMPKDEPVGADDKTATVSEARGIESFTNDSTRMTLNGNSERRNPIVKPEKDVEKENHDIPAKGESSVDKGKALTVDGATEDAGQGNKIADSSTTPPPKDGVTKKYHGPLFDFQSFTRKHDLLNSATPNYPNSFRIAYDVKDLLLEEGKVITTKKRTENLKKINMLLAVNLERKRIRPDLVVRLQIEEKKLRLLDLQARLREEVDQRQQEIMIMPDRPYRKFVRQCERQRSELVRQVQHLQKASREKQLKSIFQWRKKLLESHWAIRDARTARNRGVAKYHERMLREFSKRKDDDRDKRMEALKNNDVDRYREILLEQQTNIPGDAAQRYEVLSSFLSQTEEYLYKLGGKITAAKSHQDVEDAANAAAAAARAQGLSEEEVRAAAACAGEEVMIRNRFSEMNAPKDSSSVNKYYNLAHAVTERVVRQPSLLRAGTLRDYQLVGLQWMLSLYNNKLNGILADEMGLGKTVQVMALIAYLMEFKGNYGPHLIIVPNAVLVNWKSELMNWLPSASCIFYVGTKDQRSKLFSQKVCAVKFNVLVTTYEFIMYDRSKLSKIDWKYIIIDEAQRMKDRESVLARDLDRYRCQRRLLLTGTPLQNELKELWSLLNLLLPEVFDNRKAFHAWFSKPFQKDVPSHNAEEDDWLETEKKVIIIHRLHQILEPFMLRRRVEDVEGSLPQKVSIVLRCRMSAIQGAIYDWIRSTGTIRVDPEDEMRRLQKNSLYQIKNYKNLNNKCMELRKVCNHPLLSYPYYNDYSKEFVVRSCGKLWVLDRILIKLHRAGHRVLLFSTMTKLLDILEEYLQWRRLVYRRIDGTTSLEDRESAIVDFNRPDSNCFIFLLSIRAAGRGLNLQTADTVVIYDPDPNPQNEEQAVARAHRIGQKREVKVIYMEAVVDKISSYRKEDEVRTGGVIDSDDDLAGKDRYIGSIESLIRNNIQQYKIDMANEVINAGRFDQRTTHEERRMTLETLLHDEERYQETVHDVPSMQEVNRMIARSEEEVELFDQMDEDLDWTTDMVKYNELPKWLRVNSKDVDAAVASVSKKPSKNILSVNSERKENHHSLNGSSPGKSERRRGRPRASSSNKYPIYRELDDSDGDDLDVDSEERNVFEEEGEIGEFEEEELNVVGDPMPSNKDQVEEEELVCDDGGFEVSRPIGSGEDNVFEEAGSSGSSSGSRRLQQPETPSMSSRKFGSLSALDARPGSSKRIQDELEEGEIAVSGDSHMEMHQSGSWLHGNEDGEDEQVMQPKLKRKRSIRLRPRFAAERVHERATRDSTFFQHGSKPHMKVEQGHGLQFRTDATESPVEGVSRRHEKSSSNMKQRHNISSRKISPRVTQKSGRLSNVSGPADDGNEHSRESWSSKGMSSSGPSSMARRMSDITQRKCKNVISKLQRRINKEGNQILPLLSDLWRRNESPRFPMPSTTGSAVLDLLTIEHRVDNLEYNGVPDFVSDVQLMLKSVVKHYDYSHEVKYEAAKLRDIFFDIMKIAFPDSDFREARNAMMFSSSGSVATALSQKLSSSSQSKRHAPSIKIDAESVPSKVVVRKTTRPDVNVRTKVHTAKPQDFRLHGVSRKESPDCSQLLTHPGDLVICKKKRKDRDKSAIKQRLSPASPSASRLAPVSPPSSNKNVEGPSFQRSPRPTQQTVRPHGWGCPETQQSDTSKGGSPNFMDVQWAKPVKRMRTDAGKRRPSNM